MNKQSVLASLTSILAMLLSSCSMEASITDLLEKVPAVERQRMGGTDFTHGQIVTTGSGAVIVGTFGEMAERKKLSNGVIIEGAFNE